MLCTAQHALAQDASDVDDDGGSSVGLLLGYGTQLSDSYLDPFGFGIGVRGGHTFDEPELYLGVHVNYFFGETTDLGLADVTVSTLTLGVEGGYDLYLTPLVLRPSVVVGAALSLTSGGVEGSSTDLYVAPGATLLYPIDAWFVGLDARVLVIPSDDTRTAFTAMATGGMHF